MLQILSKLFIAVIIVFYFIAITTKVSAQTCSGSSSSSCGPVQLAGCQEDSYFLSQGFQLYYCSLSASNGSGSTCLWEHPGGSAICEACVPTNEWCTLNVGDPSCQSYYNGTYWVTACPKSDCNVYSDVPSAPGGCPQNVNGIDFNACTSGCSAFCNAGTANCGACNTGGVPTNECGTASGTQTCQHNTCTSGSCTCTPQNFFPSCSTFIKNCSTNYTCPIASGGPVNCQTTVTAHAFRDENHNGVQDSGDANLTGVTTNYGGTIQTTDGSGNSQYGGFTSGQNVSITASFTNPFNGTTYTSSSINHSVTLSNSNGGYTMNFAFVPTYKVSGHVYTDYNHNGTQDAEDIGYNDTPITVTLSGVGSTTTDSSGNFSFTGVITGAYTLSISNIPATYTNSTPTSSNITVSADTTNNTFGVTPLYNISGLIYNDFDAGNCYNPSSSSGCTDKTTNPYTVHGPGTDTQYNLTSSTVTVTGNGVNQTLTRSDGTYTTGQVLKSGTYTVSYTTLPSDYHMTYPVGSVPPAFTVTVGTPGKSNACSVGTYNDATCDAWGTISNLNFGINNEISHPIYPCTDVRDETTTQDFIPNNATCGIISGNYAIVDYNNSCVTGPGIYTSGSVTPDFGFGQANIDNWLVGGATPENFTPVNPGVIRTSSSYLQTTITNNDLSTTNISDVCTSTNCYLPDNLPSGIYIWPYDTTFMGTFNTSTNTDVPGTYTFPTGKNYVFVIGDSSNQSDITFKTKIFVPSGSTATFVASKDIVVDPSVGESSITSTAGDLEGMYSADENFVIESAYASNNTRCTDTGGTKDLRFNLIGSVVTNAAGAGGSIVNQRDLCVGDLSCPTYTIGNSDGGSGATLGYTYLLNAPQAIKHKNSFWQELAP